MARHPLNTRLEKELQESLDEERQDFTQAVAAFEAEISNRDLKIAKLEEQKARDEKVIACLVHLLREI